MRRRAARRHEAPGRGSARGRDRLAEVVALLAAHPLRDLVTVDGPYPLRRRARARAVRHLVRVLPALRGREYDETDGTVTTGTFAHGRGAAARRRGDGLRRRLPAADPPDRRGQPQGPEQHPDAGPDDPGSPWAIGSRRRRPRRDPPRPRHDRRLRRLRRARPATSAWRSRSTWRCSARPTTRGSPSTRSGSPRAPTAPSPTPRTRRRSTRTSTRSTSTTTPTGIYAEVLRVVRHWMTTACGSSGSTTRTPSRSLLGVAARARSAATDPDVLFLAEAFTRPAMMHALGRSASTSRYTYFTWRNDEVGARGVPRRARRTRPPTTCGPTSSSTPRTSCTRTCSTAGRRRSRSGRCWPRRCRRPGASTPATSCSSTSRPAGQRGVPRLREVPVPAARLGRGRSEGRTLAPYLTRLNEIRRAAPGPAPAAQPHVPPRDERADHALLQQARATATTPSIVVVQPRPARARGRRWSTWTCRRSGSTGTTRFAVHDEITGADLARGAQHNYVRLDPYVEPAHVLTVQADAVSTDVRHPASSTSEQRRPRHRRCRTGRRRREPRPGLVQARGLLRGAGARRSTTPTATAPATSAALTEKLDYLQWLGVDCLWLPPFFTSPLRDGGYDVARLHRRSCPSSAPSATSVELVDAAHERGIRVIIDFVMNHTSDQHPWFQASRAATRTGRYGDFYVWSDTDEEYPDARIIFVDTEPSNWTLDPVRRQYYWHRFFSHQPDLNFDNPQGARRDARGAARSGWTWASTASGSTPCPTSTSARAPTARTSPRPTSSCARSARCIDATYPGPGAARRGEPVAGRRRRLLRRHRSRGGDECHMGFHFPVMPRIFMAVRRESRFPISEILEQTPPIPGSCQWGIFLRNHDELTLEMVTDEDRDYMWAEYAKDPRMKANIGIRRRLAPLLDNDATRWSCSPPCCCRCPGSPVLYYGDEIGMGDNIWLGDRDGVRTPMQWTPDRNAGFSTGRPRPAVPAADPGPGLRLPGVNVEAQLRELVLAAALDAPDDPGAQASTRRSGSAASPTSAAATRRCSPTSASATRTAAPTRCCASTTCPGSRSRSSSTCAAAEGRVPVELLGGVALPADRRAAVPAHPRRVRVLLVPADRTARGGHRTVTDELRPAWRRARPTTADAALRVPRGRALVRRQGPRPRRVTGVRRLGCRRRGRTPRGRDRSGRR